MPHEPEHTTAQSAVYALCDRRRQPAVYAVSKAQKAIPAAAGESPLSCPYLRPTGVVTVSDDGGSSGRLRRELGMLPPGDVRNCLVALSAMKVYLQTRSSIVFQLR